MPRTNERMRATSNQFSLISRFPRCIGSLDCTHIKIQSPGGPEPEIYRNHELSPYTTVQFGIIVDLEEISIPVCLEIIY
ncbi:hypothetical protein NQ318_022616 [Aromia moschata]|uniref:Nuclease HARBI1 n=1 Tax=Aromia moschata TaxID=1265417 RepID=A0AAV8XEQ9_9CUCU|nr:hypothetical protein NQ318_022616 [Aromia moschata]